MTSILRSTALAVCAATVLLLQPVAYAQTTVDILPDNLPDCAQSCPLIQNALTSCQANPQSAASCFCQSALLTNLKTSQDNVCSPQCTQDDFGSIRTWYESYCANPANPGSGDDSDNAATGDNNSGNNNNTPQDGTQTTTTTSPANAATPASTSLPASFLESDDLNRNESGSEWWAHHWQWVLMVIILVVAFTIIGVGGSIWYKKRRRRREGWDDPRPDMSTWAPSQHNVHDFGSHAGPMAAGAAAGMPAAAVAGGKGKGKAPAPTHPPPEQPLGAQPATTSKTGKLKKVLLRG